MGSISIFPAMYQSTILGTSVRPRAPPNAVHAKGFDVIATDPAEGAEARLRSLVGDFWPAPERIGLAPAASPARPRFDSDLTSRERTGSRRSRSPIGIHAMGFIFTSSRYWWLRFFRQRIRRPFGYWHEAYLKAKRPPDLVERLRSWVGLPSFQFCDLPRG
jgi:hypothetical protein